MDNKDNIFPEFSSKSDKNSKSAFLKQQRMERQQREILKQQTNASNKIIHFFRKYLLLKQIRQPLEIEFDRKVKDIKKLSSVVDQYQYSVVISQALIKFQLFFQVLIFLNQKNAVRNQDTLKSLIQLIMVGSEIDDPKFNIFSQLLENRQFQFRIKKLCKLILQVEIRSNADQQSGQSFNVTQNNKDFIELSGQFFKKLYKFPYQVQQWINSQKIQNKQINVKHVIQNVITVEFLIRMMQNYKEQFFTDERFNHHQYVLQKFLKKSYLDKIQKKEVIFTISLVENSFQQLFIPKYINLFSDIFDEQIDDDLRVYRGCVSNQLVNSFNNFYNLWFSHDNNVQQQSVGQFLEFCKNLIKILRSIFEHKFQQFQNTKMVIEDEWQDQEITNYYKKLFYEQPEQLQILLKINVEKFFMNTFLEQISTKIIYNLNSQKEFYIQDFELISEISLFYLELIKIQKQQKISLLIRMSFSQEFIRSLLMSLKLILISKLKSFNFDFKCISQASQIVCKNILHLFSKLFYQRLRLMDEFEFFNSKEISNRGKTNFQIEEIVDICSFLNIFAYETYYRQVIPSFKSTKKSVIKLIKELLNRDQRKNFTQIPNFWVIQQNDENFQNLIQTKFLINQDESNKLANELIREMPQIFSFQSRVQILRKLIHVDQLNQNRDFFNNTNGTLDIRRGYEVEDAYEYLKDKNLKELFKIQFVDDQGITEQGIDGGGLLKEFITIICKKLFNIEYGYFIETDEKTLVPNPNTLFFQDYLKIFKFMGTIVGKAIYENILIEPVFSRAFLNKIIGRNNDFEEIAFVDPILYKNLLKLKHTQNMTNDLDLTFTISEESYGVTKEIELKPNGKNLMVNEQNKLEYIILYSDYKINYQWKKQCQAFLQGFQSVVDPVWLNMFNHSELQLVISGKKGFDVKDLKENCITQGNVDYSTTLSDLWLVLDEFDEESKDQFILFATGCSRPPTLGFRYLNPKFCIQFYPYSENLPTSATCVNMISIPNYENFQKLKSKLIYAIKSKTGFNLA